VPRPSRGWLATVRRMLEDLSTSDVVELEIVQQDFRLRLRRDLGPRTTQPSPGPTAPESDLEICAPFTGVFYRSPSPTADLYIREGDWLEAGATIGLVETMKIFNEVKTEQPGRVVRILAESGQLVQSGDRLVLLASTPRSSEAESRP
jgi:acetyl-CoA carboxylase biotin carboxyl carrier protein